MSWTKYLTVNLSRHDLTVIDPVHMHATYLEMTGKALRFSSFLSLDGTIAAAAYGDLNARLTMTMK